MPVVRVDLDSKVSEVDIDLELDEVDLEKSMSEATLSEKKVLKANTVQDTRKVQERTKKKHR
eukprot:3307734-Amphidinium_carterae.1